MRADIASDILKHAQDDEIEIWTSVWTMVEVSRPRMPLPESFPLPTWASLLDATNEYGSLKFPEASTAFRELWEYRRKNTLPKRLIPEADEVKIRSMFDWPFINKIDVTPYVAHHAADISRRFNHQEW